MILYSKELIEGFSKPNTMILEGKAGDGSPEFFYVDKSTYEKAYYLYIKFDNVWKELCQNIQPMGLNDIYKDYGYFLYKRLPQPINSLAPLLYLIKKDILVEVATDDVETLTGMLHCVTSTIDVKQLIKLNDDMKNIDKLGTVDLQYEDEWDNIKATYVVLPKVQQVPMYVQGGVYPGTPQVNSWEDVASFDEIAAMEEDDDDDFWALLESDDSDKDKKKTVSSSDTEDDDEEQDMYEHEVVEVPEEEVEDSLSTWMDKIGGITV